MHRTPQVWDVRTSDNEVTFTGHGGDVKTVDWHPTKGVIASASKDALVKLWDARGPPGALATLHGHKATVMKVRREALILSLFWKSCCLINESIIRIYEDFTQEWPQLTAVAKISGRPLLRLTYSSQAAACLPLGLLHSCPAAFIDTLLRLSVMWHSTSE